MKTNEDELLPESENSGHDVPEHDIAGKKSKKDHYHNEHHFDASGQHDDVDINDFHFKKSIYTSQRNLIYRIVLTGVFLALAIVGTTIDMGLEFIIIPIAGVNITFRFFDLLFILLSIGSIGPIFTSIIAAVVPWMHLLIHGHGHTVYDAIIDFAGYLIITWVLWALYYVAFRNSYIHKDPNIKKDRFKRWMPIVFFAVICAAAYTGLIIAMLRLNGAFSTEEHVHSDVIINHHDAHDHDHETGTFNGKWGVLIMGLFGFELLRFGVCYAAFAVIEPQVKKLNHRWR